MVYMFNELSLAKVSSKELVYDILENFIRTVIRAKEIGFSEIRLHERSLPNLYQIDISHDYNIGLWLNDGRVSRDLRDNFRAILTSTPLIKESETSEIDFYSRSEFYKILDNIKYQVWGLGAAFIYNTLSVSLATNDEWDKNEIKISHFYLDEKAEEKNEEAVVKHFSSFETLNSHVNWYQNYQLECLKKSKEIWERRVEFFSNLELCEEIEKQIEKIGVSKTLFLIIDRLKTLNDYVKHWENGDFDYQDANQTTNLRISPESESTLRRFSSIRKFTIPGQGKKLFDLHIKTADLRLHFYPDNNSKKVYVGYIGKHLRIASED
ncbi:MAG: hypothetical protein ACHQIM_08550 [Sphingobacteriales bacterium]